MKKVITVCIYVVIATIIAFMLFITFESIRLKTNVGATPIILLDEDKISLAVIDSGTIKKKYYGIGYSVEYQYYIHQEENSDHKEINVIGADFKLFNLIRVWAWIS